MIETKKLIRSFKSGDGIVTILKGIDLCVQEGEFLAIMGRSGAGKSTLLYQLSLLDDPTSGEVIIDGQNTHGMTQEQKTRFRLTVCGYVFQDYALLPELTALDNVMLPLYMQQCTKKEAFTRATEVLMRVGLEHRLHNIPSQMSGGEQQRVSIARAIVHKPKILFADEPTANLDNESSQVVMNLFKEIHAQGQTIVMVTHEETYAQIAQSIVHIDDGKIVSVTKK
jgi:putative ABC transport system ATP-binding protein